PVAAATPVLRAAAGPPLTDLRTGFRRRSMAGSRAMGGEEASSTTISSSSGPSSASAERTARARLSGRLKTGMTTLTVGRIGEGAAPGLACGLEIVVAMGRIGPNDPKSQGHSIGVCASSDWTIEGNDHAYPRHRSDR